MLFPLKIGLMFQLCTGLAGLEGSDVLPGSGKPQRGGCDALRPNRQSKQHHRSSFPHGVPHVARSTIDTSPAETDTVCLKSALRVFKKRVSKSLKETALEA